MAIDGDWMSKNAYLPQRARLFLSRSDDTGDYNSEDTGEYNGQQKRAGFGIKEF